MNGGRRMMLDARNRFPWSERDIAYLDQAKAKRVPHKTIARKLKRTPRAIDQKWAVLRAHRAEELQLLEKVQAEAREPELLVEGRR